MLHYIKYKIQLSLLATICLFTINYSCNNKINTEKNLDSKSIPQDFIYIEDSVFKLNGESFFPLLLNYVIDFRNINDSLVISPILEYDNPSIFESNTRKECYEQLESHFQLIKEMGFNSLRICFDRIRTDSLGKYYYNADEKKYYIDTAYPLLLKEIDDLLSIAKKHELHIMLLIKPPININSELEAFTIQLLQKFQNNPTIFAYDFMNEPLYFEKDYEREKIATYKIVDHWKHIMRKHAPNQLLTIGFSEPIEVFEWDPALMPVDFVQIHTYHPLRVPSEIYWYSTYIKTPWIIGETGLQADGDSITYEEQLHFVRDAYQLTRDNGGIGFGIWNFQDIPQSYYEAHYTGLLNHKDSTFTKDGKYCIKGSIKPAGQYISKLNTNYKPKPKKQPINYFNILGYNNIVVVGKIIDKQTNQPVEGAVIRAWTEHWIGMNTFSDKNGNFKIFANAPCLHFEISAPKMSRVKFDKELFYIKLTDENYNLKDLPNCFLEYHNISYKPFLLNEDTPNIESDSSYIFNFNPKMFNKTKYISIIGDIYLEKIKIN